MGPTLRTYFVYGTLRPNAGYRPMIAEHIAHREPAYINGYALWALSEGYLRSSPEPVGSMASCSPSVRGMSSERAMSWTGSRSTRKPIRDRSTSGRSIEAFRLGKTRSEPVLVDAYLHATTRSEDLRLQGVRIESGERRI